MGVDVEPVLTMHPNLLLVQFQPITLFHTLLSHSPGDSLVEVGLSTLPNAVVMLFQSQSGLLL